MPDASEMKNLKSRKLYLQVYDEIKNYIEENHLLPGDKLPSEMKMCEMLGVSRNVLREAIKSLEITGTVSSTPGAGIVIQEFNINFFLRSLIYSISDEKQLFKEIEELRRVLELGFAKEAYESISTEDLEALYVEVQNMTDLFSQIKKSRSSIFGIKFAKSDASFHKILFHSVDNTLLKSIIEFFWACDKYYKVKTPHHNMERTVDKHHKIYLALLEKDYDKYIEAMQEHFYNFYDKT